MPAVETRAVVDPQNRRRETMRVGSEPHGDKAHSCCLTTGDLVTRRRRSSRTESKRVETVLVLRAGRVAPREPVSSHSTEHLNSQLLNEYPS